MKFIFKNICEINQAELDPYNYGLNYTKYLMINPIDELTYSFRNRYAYKKLGT